MNIIHHLPNGKRIHTCNTESCVFQLCRRCILQMEFILAPKKLSEEEMRENKAKG